MLDMAEKEYIQRGFMQLLHPTTPRTLEAIPVFKHVLFFSFSMLGAKAHLEAASISVAAFFFFLAAMRKLVVSNDGWNLLVNGC